MSGKMRLITVFMELSSALRVSDGVLAVGVVPISVSWSYDRSVAVTRGFGIGEHFTAQRIPDLHAYWVLLFIQSLTIGFTTIGVDWLYSIFEDYFYLSVRTIAVQFASLILMFIFVHKPSDYVIYAGISVFASSAANAWGFFHARKFCTLRPTRHVEVTRHIGPIMTLFMNNVASE